MVIPPLLRNLFDDSFNQIRTGPGDIIPEEINQIVLCGEITSIGSLGIL